MKPITLIIGVVLLIIAFFHKQLFGVVSSSGGGSAFNSGDLPVDNFVPRPAGGMGNEYGIISPTDPMNNPGGLFKEPFNSLFLNN